MEKQIDELILKKAAKIKLLLMDCDGVLTDGRLYYSDQGEQLKVFNVKDGQGIVMWHRAGFQSGIISGRSSKIVSIRASELGMHFVKVGSKNKAEDFEEMLKHSDVDAEQVAYIGDDLPDIILMKRVGLPIAVNDAASQVFMEVAYRTRANGGSGAVREVINLLLKAKNLQYTG